MNKGIFLTGKSRLEQTYTEGNWRLLDNELYMDSNGSIYLVPRYYETDNYTIPNWIAWLGGGKSQYDVRPSHFHDFCCQYHKRLKVKLSLSQLSKFLKGHNDMVVCKDIPVKHLVLEDVSKTETDNMFKRMILATECITNLRANILRSGVFFNVGWWLTKPDVFDMNDIYKRVND